MFTRYLQWAGNAIVIFLLAIMGVLVFFTVGSKLSPDGMPKFTDYRLMVVLSGSMSPVFEAGDVIVVSGAKKTDGYQKGDVITFKDPENPKRVVTHRVTEVIRDGNGVSYRTKGDANSEPDRLAVPSINVIGQQKLHIPYLGKVVEFANTKRGFIWLIVVPGILIIIGELRNISKIIADEVEKKKREAVAEPWSEE